MDDQREWVLIDTETNGISPPVFVVDIAAQRMRGWVAVGEPFRALLNQNVAIPPEVSRLNGYTREILERDGIPAVEAYNGLRNYVGDSPIASYNLEFDWDRVLVPEWSRLGLNRIGTRGLCLLRLSQRLLDPVPAGNCKLQTLRQFYRLPERGAHSALGDVMTVVDLINKVLRPIAERRNLVSYDALITYSSDEWFPTRLAFGKFKGRSFRDAKHDKELRAWLEWLCESKSDRTVRMAKWYISQLENEGSHPSPEVTVAAIDTASPQGPRGEIRSGIVVFNNVELDEIRYLVTAARERLADLEVIYARECNAIAVTQSKLFSILRREYKRRDDLKLVVVFRARFLDSLLSKVTDDPETVEQDYANAKDESEKKYDEATRLAESQKMLSEDQQAELKGLFRKLTRLFHPDRHVNNPETYDAYTRLTQEINLARDAGDIDKLREIANDPEGYARRIGAGTLDLSEESQLDNLKRLYESLQAQIVEMLEDLSVLRADPKYELTQLASRRPDYLEEVADIYRKQLEEECASLVAEAQRLSEEIEELTGSEPSI